MKTLKTMLAKTGKIIVMICSSIRGILKTTLANMEKYNKECEIKKQELIGQKNQELEYKNTVRNGQSMTIVEPPEGVVLKRNEICHAACLAEYMETTMEAGYGYGGVRVRVMKGVSVNTGSARKVKNEVTNEVHGVFAITNQRLMFIPKGNTKGFNLNLTKIISFQIYKDGLLLRTDTKNYTIKLRKNYVELIDITLNGALKNVS